MRALVCVIAAAIGLAAQPALAQADRTAAAFWKGVQASCDASAATPTSELGRRIAQAAIGEFALFDGHKIDANGRAFHFGLTAAEQEKEKKEDGGSRPASGDHPGWRQVMKYWQTLYGKDAADMVEVLGYSGASTSAQEAQSPTLLRPSATDLLHAADGVSDPDTREALREAVWRAAIVDTPWSAAFVSYVIRKAGVTASAFEYSNAHRAYIYDAFATSAAELAGKVGDRLYRACPLGTTKPRIGDLLCNQREPALADDSDEAVRERIRAELSVGPDVRTVRRAHCEVVAYIDAPARKMYTIGGNVEQGIAARKLNLRRRDFKFSATQKGHCSGGEWTLPQSTAHTPDTDDKCSLNDRNWFVLLQLR
jgi:hypothetical protein